MKFLPRVLLVDDEPDHLHLLSSILRSNGFDVYGLSDPNELLPVVQKFQPNLVLLDVRIGMYDGRELCKRLRSEYDSSKLKVILHSAFPQISSEYEECGAQEFLSKPADATDLI